MKFPFKFTLFFLSIFAISACADGSSDADVDAASSVAAEPVAVAESQASRPTTEHSASAAANPDESCSIAAEWSGDFSGKVEWEPEIAPGFAGFTVSYTSFSIESGLFNLSAEFEQPFVTGQTGTFTGKATDFHVNNARYEGRMGNEGNVTIFFPMNSNLASNEAPVTLQISEWEENSIAGLVTAGPFRGTAGGEETPREGGPSGPPKTLVVNGSAQFQATGEITNSLLERTQCHQPYNR
jgi:hypothetical protein